MSNISSHEKGQRGRLQETPANVLRVLEAEEEEILSAFSQGEQNIIRNRLNSLKGVVDMVSADTTIHVFANPPGAGWFWHSEHNYIRVDVEGLLQRPIEQNRFFLAHEAAHRRLTCVHVLPEKLRGDPAYHMLFNVLEDGRINLWLQEKYPTALKKGMQGFYDGMNMDEAQKAIIEQNDRATYVALAYNEMLRLWSQFSKGQKCTPTENLPGPVKEFITKALPHLKKVWAAYPTPGSEGRGLSVIEKKAKEAEKIITNKIWPLFKKLLTEEQKQGAKQKMLDQAQESSKKEKGESSDGDNEDQDESSDDEQDGNSASGGEGGGEGKGLSRADIEAMEDETGAGRGGKINSDKLSSKSKKKIDDAFDELSKDEQDQLKKDAVHDADSEMEDIAKQHEGKMGSVAEGESKKDDSNGEGEEGEGKKKKPKKQKPKKQKKGKKSENTRPARREDSGGAGTLRAGWISFDQLVHSATGTTYEALKSAVGAELQELISVLENIFIKRKLRGEDGGHRDGEDLDVDRIIDEQASTPPGTVGDPEPPVWTRKNTKEDGPRDYAFTIVLDVSPSMGGEKMKEAINALILIVEALSHFGIEIEIIGFGSYLYEVKPFDEPLTESVKGVITSLEKIEEYGTLIGRAISESALRLSERTPKQKTMIVITDGQSGDDVPSALAAAKAEDIEVIGIGIGPGTSSVKDEFGEAGIAEVPVQKLAALLAELIREKIDKR